MSSNFVEKFCLFPSAFRKIIMPYIRVELDRVHCGNTEDGSGADHLYIVGALSDGADSKGVLTSPMRINDDQTKWFDASQRVIFDSYVEPNGSIRGGVKAYDEDFGKDWAKYGATITKISDAVAAGLKATKDPYAVGAGEILSWAGKAANFLAPLDEDDFLGEKLLDIPAQGANVEEQHWEFFKKGSGWFDPGYSTWNYTVTLRITREGGTSRPSAFQVSNGKTQQIAYRGRDRSINVLWAGAGKEWVYTPAGNQAGAKLALSTPSGYITSDGDTQHIIYLGDDSHIQELFAGDKWQCNSPSAAASMPTGQGRPWGFVFGSTHHITYRGTDNQIHVLWVQDDGMNSSWVGRTPSVDATAPLAAGDPCALISNSETVENIFYRGTDGHIHQLWAGETWSHTGVTAWAQTPLAAGDPHAYLPTSDTHQHVCYRGSDGHIWVCWWDDENWVGRSPTMDAQAPLAAGDPYAVVSPDKKFQNIVYRGVDGHIYQLWANDSWSVSTVSISAGTPTAIGDPTAYFYGADQTLHIAYLGADGHFYVVWWNSKWGRKRISDIAKSPAAMA
jgi:hypothetical protein